MPFKVVQVAGGYKVQDDKGKFFSEKPMSKARCVQQMRALYANVPEASKKETGLSVFKDRAGKFRWVLFSSNAFRDYDGEIVSSKAINDDVERSEGADFGPLRWWHTEPWDLGTCDFRATSDSGRTLIESGTFHSAKVGQRIKEAAPNLQVSIGFHHPPDEPDKDGIYHTIRVFERSILPQGRAANPFTKVLVQGDEPMASKEEKRKALQTLLGDEAEAIFAQAEEREKELDASGVAFKEAAAEEEVEEKAQNKKVAPAFVKKNTGVEEVINSEDEDEEEEEETPPAPAKKKKAADDEEETVEEAPAEEVVEVFDDIPVIGNVPVAEYRSMLVDAFSQALDQFASKERQPKPSAPEVDVKALVAKVKELETALAKANRAIKELQGETPRAARGYRASEDEETVLSEESKKELGTPASDPYAVQFVNTLLGINPGA